MKQRLHILTLIAAAMTAALLTNGIAAAPVTSAAARVINTTIGRDRTLVCSLRDHYGFLWVGTMTGLACFDANGENIFANVSGILPGAEGINVNSLLEVNGNIWFGGTRGLYIFDRHANTVKRFPFKTKYGVQISSLVEDLWQAPDGKIWIPTHGQGLFIFDPKTSRLEQNSREGAFLSGIAGGPDGQVYCTTNDGRLIAFNANGTPIRRLHLPDFTADRNPVSPAFCNGRIWIAANTTIYAYTPGSDTVEPVIRDTRHGVANSLICHGKDQIWLGTDEGIFTYECSSHTLSATLTEHPMALKPTDTRVAQLREDMDGGVIAVTLTGISFIPHDSLAVRRIETPDGVVYPTTVYAVLPSSDGRKAWLGSDHGVDTYDIKTGQAAGSPLPLGADIIATSLAETDSALWIGSRHHGLFRYGLRDGKVKRYEYDDRTPYGLISNSINAIFRSSNGELFILTNWGLCRYNPWKDNFDVVTGTENAVPYLAMEEDGAGRLWTLTATNRLYVRAPEGGRFEQFTGNALRQHSVSLLFKDREGRLWAAAEGNKLLKFDEEAGDFTAEGIPVSSEYPITFIEDAGDGNLWISTDEGIVRYNPSTQSTDYSLRTDADVYSVKGAAGRLPDGTILFGSLHGLCELTPDSLGLTPPRREALPVSISFPYASDNAGELKRLGLHRMLHTIDEIQLPYSLNTFTIRLASSAEGGMPGARYQYRLEGADQAWLPVAGSEITFPHLAPGRYRLLVRTDASADDSDVHALDIRIMPPWYLSWVAITGYLLLLALLIGGYIAYARRKMKRQTAATIQDMKAHQEQEAYESKMRFFINLVHEIRTPLMLISLPLERLSEALHSPDKAKEEEEAKQNVGSMKQNLDYLLGITNQLLDFRKAESNSEIRLKRSRCDLNALLKEIAGRFERPLQTSGKAITLTLPERETEAVIDRDKTERLLMNLVGNAMKYATSHISLTLSTTEGDAVEISVCDDGPGVPAEERDRIFDTYYQIGNDDTAASLGTGLGLAYARLIATAHKGTISVDENEGGGARFTLTLPKGSDADAEAEHSPETESLPVTSAETPDDSKKITVLLVEDNAELRAMVATALGRTFRTVTAEDGADALEKLEANEVDLVVSDVMMPRIDGIELCRRCKEDVRYSHLPFVMLTAKTGDEAREEGLQSGADAYLEKPFPMKQLSLVIANLLRTRLKFYEHMRETVGNKAAPRNHEEPGLNRVDSEFLQKLNSTIESSLDDEDFSIDSLAEKLNLSRSSFYRKLTGVTGMTPSDYLKNFRLNRAAALLKEGCRITEAAERVGFTSASYFAKCFRDKFGMLPSEYK